MGERDRCFTRSGLTVSAGPDGSVRNRAGREIGSCPILRPALCRPAQLQKISSSGSVYRSSRCWTWGRRISKWRASLELVWRLADGADGEESRLKNVNTEFARGTHRVAVDTVGRVELSFGCALSFVSDGWRTMPLYPGPDWLVCCLRRWSLGSN